MKNLTKMTIAALVMLAPAMVMSAEATKIVKIHKSEEEWKKILTPEQYRIMRTAATEIACSGEYWQNHEDGVYRCAACGLPLFDSRDKFESHTGWPSFVKTYAPGNVEEKEDRQEQAAFLRAAQASAVSFMKENPY